MDEAPLGCTRYYTECTGRISLVERVLVAAKCGPGGFRDRISSPRTLIPPDTLSRWVNGSHGQESFHPTTEESVVRRRPRTTRRTCRGRGRRAPHTFAANRAIRFPESRRVRLTGKRWSVLADSVIMVSAEEDAAEWQRQSLRGVAPSRGAKG